VYALRVDVQRLRPWEYDQMESDRYEMVTHLQEVWRAAQEQFPAGWDDVSRRGR
jgi:hypothetical protein